MSAFLPVISTRFPRDKPFDLIFDLIILPQKKLQKVTHKENKKLKNRNLWWGDPNRSQKAYFDIGLPRHSLNKYTKYVQAAHKIQDTDKCS